MRRTLAVTLAFAFAAPSAVAATRVFCRMGDCTLEAPCCDDPASTPAPAVSAADCCEEETMRLSRGTPRPPEDPKPIASALFVVAAVDVHTGVADLHAGRRPDPGRAPRASIRVLHASLLL